MSSPSFLWHAFMIKPLWVLMIAQLAIVISGGSVGYYLVLYGDIQVIEASRARNALVMMEYHAIVQHLATLPPQKTLLHQLAVLEENAQERDSTTLAARLASPLNASGATLLSLQHLPSQHLATVSATAPLTPHSPVPLGMVTVSTDYHGALDFLRTMTAMSQPLRLHSLVVSVQNATLHMEMALSFPTRDTAP